MALADELRRQKDRLSELNMQKGEQRNGVLLVEENVDTQQITLFVSRFPSTRVIIPLQTRFLIAVWVSTFSSINNIKIWHHDIIWIQVIHAEQKLQRLKAQLADVRAAGENIDPSELIAQLQVRIIKL